MKQFHTTLKDIRRHCSHWFEKDLRRLRMQLTVLSHYRFHRYCESSRGRKPNPVKEGSSIKTNTTISEPRVDTPTFIDTFQGRGFRC